MARNHSLRYLFNIIFIANIFQRYNGGYSTIILVVEDTDAIPGGVF